MTDPQIIAAATDLALKVAAANLPTIKCLSSVAVGVAAIAIADEQGVIVFEDDPTATTRLVRAREEAAQLVVDHVLALQGTGVKGVSVADLIEHLIHRIDRIRAAAVGGVES